MRVAAPPAPAVPRRTRTPSPRATPLSSRSRHRPRAPRPRPPPAHACGALCAWPPCAQWAAPTPPPLPTRKPSAPGTSASECTRRRGGVRAGGRGANAVNAGGQGAPGSVWRGVRCGVRSHGCLRVCVSSSASAFGMLDTSGGLATTVELSISATGLAKVRVAPRSSHSLSVCVCVCVCLLVCLRVLVCPSSQSALLCRRT